ncbi:phosphopantothenate/pantothenate synthetase [Candidatus Thorarchaeota archaeon]|nr:MAG: phosphopantothenate/pantothenate synthetase [Candidatus Thorarchaeota archaeon]
MEIPADHPRRVSLQTRETIIEGHEKHIVATAGLLAHGRGEAFDYLLGETTPPFSEQAMQVAVAAMLLAEHPVISVNGNVCSLVPEELVELSELVEAPLEINLFYYRKEREEAILDALLQAGAEEVLGTYDRPSATIPELSSNRRKVDPDGIGSADLVLVPLEDGDRTEALKKVGKFVVTVDLNPLSRTSVYSDVTIVDNIIRAVPHMVELAREMKDMPRADLKSIRDDFDNVENLREAIEYIVNHLERQSQDLPSMRLRVGETS